MAGPVAGFAPHPGREPTGCVSREQQAEAIIRRIVNKHGMPLRRPKTFSWQLYGAPSSTPYVRDHLEGVSSAVMECEYRRIISSMGEATLGAFRSTPLGMSRRGASSPRRGLSWVADRPALRSDSW